MPVPTETFRSMKALHWIFLVSAALLLVSTLLLVKRDAEREFNQYQLASRVWERAMKVEAQQLAMSNDAKQEIERLKVTVEEMRQAIESNTDVQDAEKEIRELQRSVIDTKKLALDIAKGKMTPKEQELDRARNARQDTRQLEEDLNKIISQYTALNDKIAHAEARLETEQAKLEQARKELNEKEGDLRKAELTMTSLQEAVDKAMPTGLGAIGDHMRNAPLSNWMNPSTGPKEYVVSGVRTDLNFMTVDTWDRCQSCHVNIENPAYEENNLVAFVERQIAAGEGQEVNNLREPVVMLDYWVNAAKKAGLDAKLNLIAEQGWTDLETAAGKAKQTFTKGDGLDALVAKMTDVSKKRSSDVGRDNFAATYEPVIAFSERIKGAIHQKIGDQQYELLKDNYRYAAIAKYNEIRDAAGLVALSDSPVLLGHPQIELYASPDSAHAATSMGCTVCHEGAGQETQFEHTAHSPRDIWVDARTGAPLPRFLVSADEHGEGHGGGGHEESQGGNVADKHQPAPTGEKVSADHGAVITLAANVKAEDAEDHSAAAHKSEGKPVYSQSDLYLPDPTDETHPFQPDHDHNTTGTYTPPTTTGEEAETRNAVKQAVYWKKRFGWHHIHYMHWEKPMHSLLYVESSCSKCHDEIFDVKAEAPRLFEGRKLFAQLGCVNCHSVEGIADDLDIKRMGPSLVNVKDKMSPDMLASWIWAPKALRPTTRMPHYFMLENNSQPDDIRRTRTEVAAISFYLLNTRPGETEASTEYWRKEYRQRLEQETRKVMTDEEAKKLNPLRFLPKYEVPELSDEYKVVDDEASREIGKEIFNKVGCMACHMNLEDQAAPLLVTDYANRFDVSIDDAKYVLNLNAYDEDNTKYAEGNDKLPEQMSYNQRHWYAQRYLGDELNLVGPELSAVGTKLLAGRKGTKEENLVAAKTWLWDWLKNPRHYSSYTIMPSLRLTDVEAHHLANYLLSLQRDADDPSEAYEASVFLGETSQYKRDLFKKVTVDGEEKLAGASSQVFEYMPNESELDLKMLDELILALNAAQGNRELFVETEFKGRIRTMKDGDNVVTLYGSDRKPAKHWDTAEKLRYLGEKMVSHYGCSGCHLINGFEEAANACVSISSENWGLKDPHKLDFGYLDSHIFGPQQRGEYAEGVDKVVHEGLASSAVHLGEKPEDGTFDKIEYNQVVKKDLIWEDIHELERRPWLYHKLHNTRVYDRGKTTLDKAQPDQVAFTVGDEVAPIGKPYDKLKMPKFFLNDDQVHSLITFVTSVRQPLVSEDLRASTYSRERRQIARGRQIATMYNCYGCHNIEAEQVAIHKYYGLENGPWASPTAASPMAKNDKLNWAPPRLIGQGAKTQPDWLYHFLRNVNGHPNPVHGDDYQITGEDKIRPWLLVRMPSFPLAESDATALVDYFAGHSQLLSRELADASTEIRKHRDVLTERVTTKQAELDAAKAELTAAEEAALENPSNSALAGRVKTLRDNVQKLESDLKFAIRKHETWYETDNDAFNRVMRQMIDFSVRADIIPSTQALDTRYTNEGNVKSAWENIARQMNLLSGAFHTDYPYVPKGAPDISDEQLSRGLGLFKEMACQTGQCHRLGNEQILASKSLLLPPYESIFTKLSGESGSGATEGEDDGGYEDEGEDEGYEEEAADEDGGYEDADEDEGYGDEDEDDSAVAAAKFLAIGPIAAQVNDPPPGAPNLSMVPFRLQRGWMNVWVQHPNLMLPGTNMLPQWPENQSHFAIYPDKDMRDEKESLFGFTRDTQRDILFDFLFTAGRDNLTVNPFATGMDDAILAGGEAIELTPLEQLSKLEKPELLPEEEQAMAEGPAIEIPDLPEPGEQAGDPNKSNIQNFHDDAKAAFDGGASRIIGVVKFAGNAPRPKPIRMDSDPNCIPHWQGKPLPLDQSLVVKNGAVQYTMVYVKSGHENVKWEMPKTGVLLDQVGCRYTPHVVGVIAGQTLVIQNSDPTLHNVNFTPSNGSPNPGFNVGQVQGSRKAVKLEPAMGESLTCQVHTWMNAWINVFDHPFFSVSDVEGKFEIKGLPPGTYTLSTWHEDSKIKPVEFKVTVEENSSHRADVTVSN